MSKGEIKENQQWPLVGNSQVVNFLTRSAANQQVAGSYIFCGPDNLGKTTTALYFAKLLVCQNKISGSMASPCGDCPVCRQAESGLHGDIHLVKREQDKKNISIEQVRELIRTLGLSSFLNSYKIGLIKGAHDLSDEALNGLLKTLEEPKDKVVIILITSDLDSLPETIVSRSQIVKFLPVSYETIYDYLVNNYRAKRSQAKDLARLSLGRPALAIKFFENQEFLRQYTERGLAFLSFFKQDLNQRLNSVEQLIGPKAGGQEANRLAGRIIDIWQGLVRDLLLVKFNQVDLIQHSALGQELERLDNQLRINLLLNINYKLEQARDYLKANVNPGLALGEIALAV